MPRKTSFAQSQDPDWQAASMRPRPDAAENASRPRRSRPAGRRFNEAAARCRGKRRVPAGGRGTDAGFNEAAARCRGKQTCSPDACGGRFSFNEAAARCRGKPEYASDRSSTFRRLQ